MYILCLEQELRDKGLDKLTRLLIKEQRWVELEQPTQQKHLRVAWEGLFFSKFDDLNKIISNEYSLYLFCSVLARG